VWHFLLLREILDEVGVVDEAEDEAGEVEVDDDLLPQFLLLKLSSQHLRVL
jgi:hypothetical protein